MTPALATSVAVGLVAYNTVVNLRWPGDRWYVPRNIAVGAGLVGVARLAGLSWAELGLGPGALEVGWRWGRGIVLVVVLAVSVGVAIAPRAAFVERLLSDRRADLDDRDLAWQALIRIPVGTAAFEEVAFRGVLLGLLLETAPTVPAVIVSALAFGLWHVGPTLVAHEENAAANGRLAAVAIAVVATTAAGVLLAWLRLTSSLVAVVLVHWATNSLGLLAAAVHQRTERGA